MRPLQHEQITKTLQWVAVIATGAAVLFLVIALVATVAELPLLDSGGPVFFLAALGPLAFAMSRIGMVVAALAVLPLFVFYLTMPPEKKKEEAVYGSGERINPNEIADKFKSHW